MEETSQFVYDICECGGVIRSMVFYPMIPKGEIIIRIIPVNMLNDDIKKYLMLSEIYIKS